MGSKKIATVVALALIVGLSFFFLRQTKTSTPVLRLYTWSNYFSDEVLRKFTERTGVKVEVSFLSSNEELFAKLRAGASGFDVIQPSDYMIRQLIKQQMIQPLNRAEIPNLSHLDKTFQNTPYDPDSRYSVPFTWGTTGIAVNTSKVQIPKDGVGWGMLLQSPDPKHTALLDDMREVFGAVLRTQGETINSQSKTALESARMKIHGLKDSILMFNSEPKSLLLKGELNLAHIYSCDGAQAHAENPAIQYFIPKEGGTLWTDNFAIPARAQNVKEAHQFINFVHDPEIAVEIVREKKLATPNLTAKGKLDPKDQVDPSVYPPAEELKRMQYLDDIGETLDVVSRMWTELKS